MGRRDADDLGPDYRGEGERCSVNQELVQQFRRRAALVGEDQARNPKSADCVVAFTDAGARRSRDGLELGIRRYRKLARYNEIVWPKCRLLLVFLVRYHTIHET